MSSSTNTRVVDVDWAPFRQEFPILFGGESPSWLSIGQGWFCIMWDLCVTLEGIARQRLEAGYPPMRIVQVKEKFGELRCYLENGSQEADDLAMAVRKRSWTICEVCGKPGNACVIRSWFKTLCLYHELEFGATARIEGRR